MKLLLKETFAVSFFLFQIIKYLLNSALFIECGHIGDRGATLKVGEGGTDNTFFSVTIIFKTVGAGGCLRADSDIVVESNPVQNLKKDYNVIQILTHLKVIDT